MGHNNQNGPRFLRPVNLFVRDPLTRPTFHSNGLPSAESVAPGVSGFIQATGNWKTSRKNPHQQWFFSGEKLTEKPPFCSKGIMYVYEYCIHIYFISTNYIICGFSSTAMFVYQSGIKSFHPSRFFFCWRRLLCP